MTLTVSAVICVCLPAKRFQEKFEVWSPPGLDVGRCQAIKHSDGGAVPQFPPFHLASLATLIKSLPLEETGIVSSEDAPHALAAYGGRQQKLKFEGDNKK